MTDDAGGRGCVRGLLTSWLCPCVYEGSGAALVGHQGNINCRLKQGRACARQEYGELWRGRRRDMGDRVTAGWRQRNTGCKMLYGKSHTADEVHERARTRQLSLYGEGGCMTALQKYDVCQCELTCVLAPAGAHC